MQYRLSQIWEPVPEKKPADGLDIEQQLEYWGRQKHATPGAVECDRMLQEAATEIKRLREHNKATLEIKQKMAERIKALDELRGKLVEQLTQERDEARKESQSASMEHQALINKLAAARRACFPDKPCEMKGAILEMRDEILDLRMKVKRPQAFRREVATQCLAWLLAYSDDDSLDALTKRAVEYADALLKKLGKEEKQDGD